MARTSKVYRVTGVSWSGPRLGMGVGRRLRRISIPQIPNGGVLSESELSDYVDRLRFSVEFAARRLRFGHLLKLRVMGTDGSAGTKVLGEAGIKVGHVYSRSLPTLSAYRFDHYDIHD